MPALHEKLRKQLEKTVIAARDTAEEAAREALKRLAVDQPKLFGHMTPDERELRNKLRAKAKQLGDRRDKRRNQAIDHLVIECAYEHWHRMLFARFLAENHLLIHDEMGVPVSLEECEELAKEEGTDGWTLAARFASRMLPQIFRPDDPALAFTLAPESKRALENQLDTLPPEVFTADDSLGWVYQFWQTKRKDEVNKSGDKIGADELPTVTQLFTEHYMVLFLLHNTVGAWWAGKVLGDQVGGGEELSEDEWRKRVALPGCDFEYLRFLPDGTPAAGRFSGWPKGAKDLKILDPCCGSGHFLVASFDLMVRIRMQEERLSARESCDAVLCDNIFGLEIDQRCTQIAAFALRLAVWRFPQADGYRELHEPHIACSGIGPHATEEQWLKLAEQSGVPMLAIGKQPIREGLRNLHALFSQAPTLGSLINPAELPADLIAADYETIQPYLTAIMSAEKADDETRERAIAAAGMVKAAELLAGEYTLVITNVPYLKRGNQSEALMSFCARCYGDAKTDLATVFLERSRGLCGEHGTLAFVLPQNWRFQDGYIDLRKRWLRNSTWRFVCALGPRAFETISGEVVNVALFLIDPASAPGDEHEVQYVDCTGGATPQDKARLARTLELRAARQADQLKNPDARVTFEAISKIPLLQDSASSYQGIKTGDDPRFRRKFWEVNCADDRWRRFQSTVEQSQHYGGLEHVVDWEDDGKQMARRQGLRAWGRRGVAVSQMSSLPCALYHGTAFDSNMSAIVPREQGLVATIYALCASETFETEVRKIDKSLKPTNTALIKIPFDRLHWQQIAQEAGPFPEPHSVDPTQWLFGGSVDRSVMPLQVGVGRLLGYCWPEQNEDVIDVLVDDDGVVCIPAVLGERAAADRVRGLLAAAYGNEWSPAKHEELLSSVGYGGKNLEEWLRDGFFEQHYKLFHHRPFIWHIWDGRKKDGFGALVNYHMLNAKLLDRLIYTYLGDWIKRQVQAVAQGESGADARLLAAQQLRDKLKLIAEGKPPYDIFVRWKPIEEQSIGWNPDLNDGVRMNIRPFMEANILRKKPNIKWSKDRGKEPRRPQERYPWFYDEDGEPTGDRVNNVHLTNSEKLEARSFLQVARQQHLERSH